MEWDAFEAVLAAERQAVRNIEARPWGAWYVMQEIEPCGWRVDLGVLGVPPGTSEEQVREAALRAGLATEDPGCFGPLEAKYLTAPDGGPREPFCSRLVSWSVLMDLAERSRPPAEHGARAFGRAGAALSPEEPEEMAHELFPDD